MNKHLFTKVFLFVAAGCAVLLLLGGDAVAASENCSMIGSWSGTTGGNTWFIIFTRGSSATVGQLYFHWTRFDPSPGVQVSDGMGVWEKVDDGLYKWTFLFYGYNADGSIAYASRISGTSSLVDCNNMDDAWVFEVWFGDQDINTVPPDWCESGTGIEERMLLVQPVCEQ